MTAQSASKETTLDLVDRQVETPVSAARRRRYWLVWWLWAVFGAAVSFRGMPAGGLLIASAVLTAPFWVLFAVWPIFMAARSPAFKDALGGRNGCSSGSQSAAERIGLIGRRSRRHCAAGHFGS